MTALLRMWDRLAGHYLTASKNTNRPSEVPTLQTLLLLSMPSAVATPLLGMRPQSSTPTHTCIHDVHWRHGTSGVSPTLWIGSVGTSPLHMTGSLHAPPLTPEVRARAISFNFLPKLWTEHLHVFCVFFVYLKVVCLVICMFHWWGLLHGGWNVWIIINCCWCEWRKQ